MWGDFNRAERIVGKMKQNTYLFIYFGLNFQVPSMITYYREYNTETKVNFVVEMDGSNLEKARAEGLHKVFKLQTTMATTSMVLFDSNGCIRFYDTPEDILHEFYRVRLDGYVRRKDYLVGLLEAEAKRLSNQVTDKNS